MIKYSYWEITLKIIKVLLDLLSFNCFFGAEEISVSRKSAWYTGETRTVCTTRHSVLAACICNKFRAILSYNWLMNSEL
jgi:hypothetical protein